MCLLQMKMSTNKRNDEIISEHVCDHHIHNDKLIDPQNINTIISKHRRIVYNRVPKTGSGPARIHMETLLLQKGYNVIHYGKHDASHASEEILQEVCDKTKAVPEPWLYIGHIHFVNFTKYGCDEQPLYINLVRDPTDCFISTYYFLRFKHPRKMSEERRNMTFDDCVMSNHPECSNYENITRIIPYFCGQESYCLERGPRALDKAKENILRYYSVIGYLENVDEYYNALEIMLPHFFEGLVDEYQTRGKAFKEKSSGSRKVPPSDVALEEFRNRIWHEYELYRFIKQRFDCMMTKIKEFRQVPGKT